MVIDIHVHARPGTPATEHRQLVEYFRRGGIGMILVSSVGNFEGYPDKATVRASNDSSESFAATAGEFARWLAYVNPHNDDWEAELDRCLAAGAIGIKLWTALKDESGSLARTHDVIARAGRDGLPVLIHMFVKTGGNMPGEINISEFAELARACPDAILVAAHAGGNGRQSIGALRDLPNACVDVCGSFPARGMVEALVADLGPDRVLYGSDMPGRCLASQLAKVVLAEISAEDKERILWRNAARVFGLEVSATAAATESLAPAVVAEPDVDHFCFCGSWPFFRAVCPTPDDLQDALCAAGMRQAFAADLGSVFRLDLARANHDFAASCAGRERIAPLAIVNPRAPNWPAVFADLPESAAGVFVSPYLHNWTLGDPAPMAVLEQCAGAARPVWVNCAFGDHRFRHSAMAYRPVASEDVAAFLEGAPPNAYVLQGLGLGTLRSVAELLRKRQDVRVEISRLTDLHGALPAAREAGLSDSLVMGTEFPLRHMDEVRWTAERL